MPGRRAERADVCRCAGITLSLKQVARGTELAAQQGVANVRFQVTD
jgi:hypothetical protein